MILLPFLFKHIRRLEMLPCVTDKTYREAYQRPSDGHGMTFMFVVIHSICSLKKCFAPLMHNRNWQDKDAELLLALLSVLWVPLWFSRRSSNVGFTLKLILSNVYFHMVFAWVVCFIRNKYMHTQRGLMQSAFSLRTPKGYDSTILGSVFYIRSWDLSQRRQIADSATPPVW